MNKKKAYLRINCIFVILAIVLIVRQTILVEPAEIFTQIHLGYVIFFFLIELFAVHAVKMFRFYFVLMEEKIPIGRFIKVYLKTTFVNFVFPFKTGELFRVYCFAHETNEFQIGLFGVIVDRFFDTCTLLILLIPYELLTGGSFSMVTGMLLLFTVFIIFIYWMFGSTYQYLNRYFIQSVHTKKGMKILYILELSKSWYDYVRHLMRGRYALILLFSCIGWMTEFIALSSLAVLLGYPFGLEGFAEYIQAIFGAADTGVLYVYICISSIVLAGLAVLVYLVSSIKCEKNF